MAFIDEIRSEQLPKIDTWINEAKFGLTYIEDPLAKLQPNDNVLEVGCGSGLLMGLVKERFPDLNLDGLEPFGDGFTQLDSFQKHPIVKELNIVRSGYEAYETKKKYDLIYLVNVFEHLQDWRDFITFVTKKLSEKGRCIILCPNYGFPYESHFRLPVIFNKNLTHSIFNKKIENLEKRDDCHGLWNSLNFVKLSQVRKYCKKEGVDFVDHNKIITDMVNRLDSDKEFAERQKAISSIAKFSKRIGMFSLFDVPFFQNFMPYIMLEIGNVEPTTN